MSELIEEVIIATPEEIIEQLYKPEIESIWIGKDKKERFLDHVKTLLPEEGNLDLCLTCGLCSSGCPASGIDGLDPRKVLRMAVLGMDEELTTTPWAWACTMCMRCVYVCPMHVNIPQLVFNMRTMWPEEKKPKGIVNSCQAALNDVSNSAMGITSEMFTELVEELVEEVRDEQEGFEDLQAPIDKKGVRYVLNQNSREPQMEEDEMVPLWKILHTAGEGDNWTYSSKGWAAENYCMFAADDEKWEEVIRNKAKGMEELGAKVWLNTE